MSLKKTKTELEKYEKQLLKLEKELEKVRDSSWQKDGIQTQRYAKKQRKYDYLAIEKFELKKKIEQLKSSLGFHL